MSKNLVCVLTVAVRYTTQQCQHEKVKNISNDFSSKCNTIKSGAFLKRKSFVLPFKSNDDDTPRNLNIVTKASAVKL